MTNRSFALVGVVVILLVVGVFIISRNTPPEVIPNQNNGISTSTPTGPATKDDFIVLTSPAYGATVQSPLTITGRARGQWYFEASFPVKIYDSTGKLLVQGPAQAQGEWMTTEYVPFSVTLNFTPTTATGTLVLEKDNPSGLPEHDNELRVPIKFSYDANQTTIKLFFYNPALDQNACSKNGLVSVNRTIPKTKTPLKDSIQLLLNGIVSDAESKQGLTTQFPLSGVTLKSATISSGIATLTFEDPMNKTGGGSCRVSVLRSQIEATAKQFATVSQVRLMPESLFQP